MSTKDSELLEQQRQRRKRINRLKTTIIMSIAIWMLVSFLAIIALVVQVVKLNSRVYKLELQQQTIGYVDSETSEVSEKTDSEVVSESENPYANIETGIDSADNMASESDKHSVYLTFDCIPSENTESILDALNECGVKATFFVSGDESELSKNIYKRIVDEGHTIGMHSYSNQYSLIYDSVEGFESDFKKLYDYIHDVTGVDCQFYRFPGGSGNEVSNVNMAEFVKILNQKSITYFDWNVSAGDTSSDYTVEDVVNNVTGGIKMYKTSIVLLRDDSSKTVTAEAIRPLIQELKANNADVLPIDESTYVVQYIKADSVE